LTPLRWLEPAALEALEAAEYYGERMPRGAQQFGEQLWAVVGRLREYPESGTPYGLPHRRAVFRSYPYSVVYRADADGILIVAVKHDRMMPVSWEART
jgi:plasmid stabilization system protein ParE